jgi:hypothetical protein
MDKENRIIELVKINVNKYTIGDFEKLRPKTQEQLVQIEKSLQQFIEEQNVIAEKIKEYSKLNLLTITTISGVRRSTVYHNENTLKKYIEERIEEVKSEDIFHLDKMKKLQLDIQFQKTYLENLQYHLIENEVLETKIRSLDTEVQDIYKHNEALMQQIFNLKQENNKLRQELKNSTSISNKVISL